MGKLLKILHLEDFAPDAELVARVLTRANITFEALVVDSGEAFKKQLHEFKPDAILSDHSLPTFNSREALTMVKSEGIKVPFILVTATVSEEFAVSVLKEGADDYILKDHLQRLPNALLHAVDKQRLEQEGEEYFQKIVQQEKELNIAHQRLLFHIENSPLGFIEFANNGEIKFWSNRTEEIFGWKEEEVIGKTRGWGHVYPEDLRIAKGKVEELLSGTVARNTATYRNYRKDGKVIWCEWYNSIEKNEEGTTILSLVRDITKRKEAEAKLRHSEERYRELVETAPEAILIFDLGKGTYIDGNENAADLVGYPLQTLFEKSPVDISPHFQPDGKTSSERVNELTTQTLTKRQCVTEWMFRKSDGTDIICEVRLILLKHNNGSQRIRASIIDISERKAAELERILLTEDLSKRNKDLEQFTYIVSHNLRGPLSTILGLCQLMKDVKLNEQELEQMVDGLYISAQNLDAIIRDLNKIVSVRMQFDENHGGGCF